ncbi:hypothetical protein BDV18DRAFT_71497 [Aspergillus unguis]
MEKVKENDKRSTRFELGQALRNQSNNSHQAPSPPSPPSQPCEPRSNVLAEGSPRKKPRGKIIRGSPKAFTLAKISELGHNASSEPHVWDESPWSTYRVSYECDLAGPEYVCVRRSGSRAVRAIHQYPSEVADKILQILRDTRHENVVSALGCFRTPQALYTLGIFYPLTLGHVVACKAFPDQQQLAAIMTQVLNGFSYLIDHDLQHNSLDCSAILMNMEGEIQIARLDHFSARPPGKVQPKELFSIASVMMELMQKYVKGGGAVGVDNIERWPTDSAAVDFLSATTSASSMEGLKKHRLLTETNWSRHDLVGLAYFALISARTFYSYKPWSDGYE